MENKSVGWLGYNYSNDRMGILNNLDLWEEDGLHCGQGLWVFIDNEWKADRLEMYQGQWYLVESKLKGDELEGLKVKY